MPILTLLPILLHTECCSYFNTKIEDMSKMQTLSVSNNILLHVLIQISKIKNFYTNKIYEKLKLQIDLIRCCNVSTECNAGYYGSPSTTCTLCSGNMIKPSQGDAPSCDIECDPAWSQPNAERTACGKD